MMTVFKIRLDDEGKEPLVRFQLEYRRIIVLKMVVGSLPQICMSIGCDQDFVF